MLLFSQLLALFSQMAAGSCPLAGEIIWKTSSKLTVDQMRSSKSRRLKVTLPVKQNKYPPHWNFRDAADGDFHPDYVGFIMWSRKECGIDFLEAWDDGRLSFDILETYKLGEKHITYMIYHITQY